MTKKEFLQEIKKNPKYEYALNNIIINIYNSLAVKINTKGTNAQIDFLEEEGLTLKQIFEKIQKQMLFEK
jgi:hypothetical protein